MLVGTRTGRFSAKSVSGLLPELVFRLASGWKTGNDQEEQLNSDSATTKAWHGDGQVVSRGHRVSHTQYGVTICRVQQRQHDTLRLERIY